VIVTDEFYEARRLLPAEYRQALKNYSMAEEIRLRCGQRPSVIFAGRITDFSENIITEKDLLHVVEVASEASLHSSSEFIASGFLNYRGLRIGLCGHAVYTNSEFKGFKKFTSIAIRIPHTLCGCLPQEIIGELLSKPTNILIVAGPGIGKTTALRELVYSFSENNYRVSLLDERGEFTAESMNGILGKNTDIMSFVPKARAAALVLRSMNPQIIAMDEISMAEDIEAIFDIIGCGAFVFATAHAWGPEDMRRRPLYRKLIDDAVFENILTVSLVNGKRKYSLERIKQ